MYTEQDSHRSTSPVTDEQLLLEYRQTGNRDLFAALVRRYEREMYSYLRRYLGDAEMAEDAFQATFLQIHLKSDQFEEGRKFRPWLYAIATNQAIDAQRRNRRHRMVSLDQASGEMRDEVGKLVDVLASDDSEPITHLSRMERGSMVREALEELSEPMRNVVHLVFYQGLKYREAAEALSVPVGTVKSRLHTAIAKLSEVWKNAHEFQD
ncbi:MAG: sigma-70 family RNA polymerase sigma factor [Pirellulaceae bacterium]